MFNVETIQKSASLAPHVYYKIGGPAEMLYVAQSADDLKGILNYAINKKIPYLVLGGGANVLVPDEGLKGLVIVNKSSNYSIDEENQKLVSDSGVLLKELVRDLAMRGWAGLEHLGNIPGTVGGAVVGNAGAYGHSVSEEIDWVRFVDFSGEIITQSRDFFNFEYRTSRLKQGYKATVLEVGFSIYRKNPEELLKIVQEDEQLRKTKHPTEPSCGSFFKNISREMTAARLIEEAGLKGFSIGGAQVSEKHANFLINKGGAKAQDVKDLAEHIIRTVKEKTGYELEREVIYL